MKTEVTMERKFLGGVVRQKHKSELLSAIDLVNSYNKHIIAETGDISKAKDINQYMRLKSTEEFVETLEEELHGEKVYIKSSKEKWVHPYLLIDIALWLNPKFKVKVYQWLYDNLLVNRDVSGNSYNRMSGVVFKHHKPFTECKEEIKHIATAIQVACGVSNTKKNKWESASEEQLKLRNTIQDNICLLYPIMGSESIDYAIKKAKEKDE